MKNLKINLKKTYISENNQDDRIQKALGNIISVLNMNKCLTPMLYL